MNRFELTIYARSIRDEKKFIYHEVIQADNLVELYSKLLITTAQMQRILEVDGLSDDDIPF